MKKTIYTLIALAGLAMFTTSCSSDSLVDRETTKAEVTMTFTATQEAKSLTRTVLNDTEIEWQSTDEVTVWDGTAKNAFSVTPTQDDKTTATIAGSVTSGSSSFIAVYPNSVGQECTFASDAITGLVIPQVQTATKGTYDPAAAIMTATTSSKTLSFKNVCAFLKVTTTVPYTKIVVSATGSTNIAGEFTLTNWGTEPTLGLGLNKNTGSKIITLQTDGTTAFEAGTYYIAMAPGTYESITISCYTAETTYYQKSKSSEVTITRSNVYDMGSTTGWGGFINGYAFVDLGLPSGTLWATRNVGATTTNPEDAGKYYAWGETTAKETYTWENYAWGTDNALTKYCTSNKTILEDADDAATANWGGGWCMPTFEQIGELEDDDYTTMTHIALNGIYGTLITSKVSGYEGNSIFLPAAEHYINGSLGDPVGAENSEGYYWMKAVYSDYVLAWCASFYGENCNREYLSRSFGMSVRAVHAK